MKKILLTLCMFSYAGLFSQEVLDSFPADVDTRVVVDEPLEVVTPIVAVEEVDSVCEDKGFFCKLFEAIKNFFNNLIDTLKNLFSPSKEAAVEMIIQTDDGDVVNAENIPTDQMMVYENVEDQPSEESEDDALKLSSAKRKNLSQEPFWVQQRS